MTREDALKILKDIQRKDLEETDFLGKCAIDMAIEALTENESLAKSVIEASELLRKIRPHGKWNKTPNPNYSPFDSTSEVIYMCSKCSYSSGERITSTWNFCPNCGSDNRKRGEAE